MQAMRYTDVAIIGGGLAGSTAAAMLGRAGIAAVLIDPHVTYPPELRCEKLGGNQLTLLGKTGLADATLRATTLDGEVWEARYGHVVTRKPSDQHGIMYDTLVNTMRAQIPSDVPTIHAKVVGIANSAERQKLVLSNDEEISARLIILSNGLNPGLRHMLGIRRQVGRPTFAFPALTYWPAKTSSRMAYLTLFPIGSAMRANLMVYRDMNDPWLPAFREAPEAAMCEMMPRLERLMGKFRVTGLIRIRPADLSINENNLQPGIVLAGDAFSTSCPAAGTGTTKVFNDVQLLCNTFIPRWLASEGMDTNKLAAFYNDPEKVACEADCLAKAYHLRSLSIDDALSWRAKRWARLALRLSVGISRSVRKQFSRPGGGRTPAGYPKQGRIA
jgi:2-polyprenyl-6-methoxyphenol hydroxylase-like FAD-dependent oxidoreductase